MVNAVAAPGGYIVIFFGLLEKIHAAEELAGVLAHEMQHIIHRHGTRMLFRERSTSMLVSLLAGSGGATEAIMESAHLLVVLGYAANTNGKQTSWQ